MRKIIVLASVLLLLFAGCAKEEAAPPRQLFVSTYTSGKNEVTSPAWFDPATGEVTYLCPDCPHSCVGNDGHCDEDVHGDECPFAKFSARYTLLGDTLYYFTTNEDYGDLYAHSLTTGETTRLLDTSPNKLWRSSFLFQGEYLFHFNNASRNGSSYGELRRLHLPGGTWEDIPGQSIPMYIEHDVGFYTIPDSNGHSAAGLYSQPLYTANEAIPAKTLLLHEVELYFTQLVTEDAIYWFGDDALPVESIEGNVVPGDLYRFDRHTQENTLLVQNFGHSNLVACGGYLYGIRRDGTRSVLMQVHATDGTQKVLYTAEADWHLIMATLEVVGDFVIVDATDGDMVCKIVYDTQTGTFERYALG